MLLKSQQEVHSPIEALIHDNRAGQDEYTNASVKQFHLEAGAKEALREAPTKAIQFQRSGGLNTSLPRCNLSYVEKPQNPNP